MGKMTSANMQPCKCGTAECHNRRERELKYVRKELSRLNEYKEWFSISTQLEKIRSEYELSTGQKLQPTAQPIQEIVLVTDADTTSKQVEDFCDLVKNLGMTPLSYAIHRDEGHEDAVTGEWISNYHAHVVVDTTCWEHRMIERPKKRNGKNVLDPVTGKPQKVLVDAYAKTIKFTREDMSRLQDYASQATGLARGVSSERMHEDARVYKAREQAREILAQAKTIESQKELIADQERNIRACVETMQGQGRDVVRNYDNQVEKIEGAGLHPEEGVVRRRNWLFQRCHQDLSSEPTSKIIELLQPLSDAITVVAMAAAAFASTLAENISRTLREKESALKSLTRQIKSMSVWRSTKAAVLALIDKPANEQMAITRSENAKMKSEVESLRTYAEEDRHEIERLKSLADYLDGECIKMDDSLKQKGSEIRALKADVAERDKTLEEWKADFLAIAKKLVNHSSPDQVKEYENLGLNRLIGENLWREAQRQKSLAEREIPMMQQSRGMKIH